MISKGKPASRATENTTSSLLCSRVRSLRVCCNWVSLLRAETKFLKFSEDTRLIKKHLSLDSSSQEFLTTARRSTSYNIKSFASPQHVHAERARFQAAHSGSSLGKHLTQHSAHFMAHCPETAEITTMVKESFTTTTRGRVSWHRHDQRQLEMNPDNGIKNASIKTKQKGLP